MKLEKILTLSLITGIIISSCSGSVEPSPANVELRYSNNSGQSLTYRELTLLNDEYKSFILRHESINNSNYKYCCQSALEDVQGAYNQVYLTLEDQSVLCFIEDQGPTFIGNYIAEKLGNNDFRYTYTFTDEVLSEFDPCVAN